MATAITHSDDFAFGAEAADVSTIDELHASRADRLGR
jgi:hypothetical protein